MQTELVERAMRGDHAAFARLADAAFPRLYGTAGLILRDEAGVREAMQTTLIRAWQDLPRLREPARFDAWLYRIAINACRDEGRRRQRASREVSLGTTDRATPMDPLAALAARDELEHAFERLTADQRAILALVYYADLTVPRAAAALGISLGTAKSRLHRALDAMRAALAAERRSEIRPEVET